LNRRFRRFDEKGRRSLPNTFCSGCILAGDNA
jgi:hypothetical protein